jgi:acetyl esterase/lipase
MRWIWLPCLALALALCTGCEREAAKPGPGPIANPAPNGPGAEKTGAAGSLAEARKSFTTRLARRESAHMRLPAPPPDLFTIIQYDSPAGKLAGYLTPDPNDGKKRPAIIWITGGDCNSVDDGCWANQPASNDQTAAQYRRAGIIMMFPTLRGGNENPGVREGFYGEIDDVVAAAEFLAKVPYVDANRIYLGGHSTGGTVVLLTAELSDRFRAVFSLGPVANPVGYGIEFTPFNTNDRREVDLRSPVKWLPSIKSPTFVFEGAGQPGNLNALQELSRASTNNKVRFFPVQGANHFSILAPLNRLIAQKILDDAGPTCSITFTDAEIAGAFRR